MELGTITGLGVGSGLNLQSMLDKLKTIAEVPVTIMQSKLVVLDAKNGAYSAISTKLTALSSSLNDLSQSFDKVKTSSSDSTIVTASITGQTNTATYDLNVSSMAQSQQLQSNGFAASTTPLSSGTFSFSIGGGTTYSIATDSNTTDSSEPSTPAELAAAINGLNTGATATLVNTGAASNPYVILLSAPSGTANTISITSTPTGTSFTQTQSAADLSMTLNGLSVTESSNNVGNLINGIQFQIINTGAASITVSNDNSQISDSVKNTVDAYNAFRATYNTETHYDSDPKKQGILMSDSNIKQVLSRVEAPFLSFNSSSSGSSANLNSLSDIGVSRNSDGTYSFDSTKLDAALLSNRAGVKQLLVGDGTSSSNSFFGHLSTALDSISNDIITPGETLFNTQKDNLNTQITTTNSFIQKQQDQLAMQFANLDTFLGKLKTIGNYLTIQIASFTKASS